MKLPPASSILLYGPSPGPAPSRISVALSFVVHCPENSSPPRRTGCPSTQSRWSVSLRSTCWSPRIPVAYPYSPCYHFLWRVCYCCWWWVLSRAASSWGRYSRWAPTWISSWWSRRWSPTSSPWKINRTWVQIQKWRPGGRFNSHLPVFHFVHGMHNTLNIILGSAASLRTHRTGHVHSELRIINSSNENENRVEFL